MREKTLEHGYGDHEGSSKGNRRSGSDDYWHGYSDGRSDREDSDTYWDAPGFPERGMTARELADFQRAFTRHARGRILGVGAEQYGNEKGQRFETYSTKELIDESIDELADVVNYATMLAISLRRIQEKLYA